MTIPTHWHVKTLGTAFKVVTGGTPPKNQKHNYGGSVMFAKPPQLLNGYITQTEDHLSETGANIARIAPPHSILVSCIGNLGKLGIVTTNTAFNQQINALYPSDQIDSKYTFYYCLTTKFLSALKAKSSGTTVDIVNKTRFEGIEFPVPPIEEQREIVRILDSAFERIDKALANVRQNIINADELFQSKLTQIFSNPDPSWKTKTLGEIGKVSMCKRVLKHQTVQTGDVPFYKIGTFGRTANAFIDKNTYVKFKEKYSFPKKGDVLISAAGTIGRRVIYDGEPAYFQDSNIVWIDNNEEQILNEYLYYFYDICDWNPSKGATISRLYNDDLRRITITFPDKETQRSIVDMFKSLAKQTEVLNKKYKTEEVALLELKKSLLQQAFTGNLLNNVI